MNYKIPIGWHKTKLGDIITLVYGKSLPQRERRNGTIPVYSSAGHTGYHDKALTKGPGIIVGRKGTIGAVYYEEKDYFCIDTAFYIQPDLNYNLKYIYYLLGNLNLNKLNSDTAVPGLNRNRAYSMEISIPKLKEQKAIADTLSALDDKIELNNKINKNLEEQAQLLFKYWFVDFEFPNEEGLPYKSSGGEMIDSELGMIPKDWEIVKFKEMFEFIKGKVPEYVSEKEDNSSPYLTKTVLDGEWGSVKYGITHTGVEANALDILMLMDGANSSDIYYGHSGLIGSTFSLLKTENENLREILYMYLTINNDEIKRQNTGSAIPHANKHYINSIKLAIPKNKEKLKIITDYFKLYRYKKIKNDKQNKKLSEIRDTLLPKLMSGEVRIPLD